MTYIWAAQPPRRGNGRPRPFSIHAHDDRSGDRQRADGRAGRSRMTQLRERDLRALLDLVGEAHAAADLAEFRAVVIPSVRRVVPAEIASYNEVAAGGHVL